MSVRAETVLPLIRNRGEAETLLSVGILGQQLDACVRVLVTELEHERLIGALCDASLQSRNAFDVAIGPLLRQALYAAKMRAPLQLDLLSKLIEQLCRLEVTIRQYGIQNLTLAQELQGHTSVAEQKKLLATMELELCTKICSVVSFSIDSAAEKMDMDEISGLASKRRKEVGVEEEINGGHENSQN